jgi:Holliday junction DNA helicase RuvA
LIAHLTGRLIQKQPNSVIVETRGGVGYELTVPLSTFYELGEVGSEITLKVYTHVREDALQLFGFHTERERQIFMHLTSVTGIGPKLAVTLLSGMSADEVVRAIRGGDLARLVAVPGVGKKTAERLVLELRDKVSSIPIGEAPAVYGAGAAIDALQSDVISALINLGYQRGAAERAVAMTLKEAKDADFQSALKTSLKRLAT